MVLLLQRWSRAPRWLGVAAEILGRRGRVRSRGRLVPFARPAVAVAWLDGAPGGVVAPGRAEVQVRGGEGVSSMSGSQVRLGGARHGEGAEGEALGVAAARQWSLWSRSPRPRHGRRQRRRG